MRCSAGSWRGAWRLIDPLSRPPVSLRLSGQTRRAFKAEWVRQRASHHEEACCGACVDNKALEEVEVDVSAVHVARVEEIFVDHFHVRVLLVVLRCEKRKARAAPLMVPYC